MGILPTASVFVVGPELEGRKEGRTIVEAHYRRAVIRAAPPERSAGP